MDLSDIENVLKARRAKLQTRVSKIDRDVSASHSKDWAEQAQERENDEVLEVIGIEAEAAIAQINLALERIENGRYGLCVDCGNPITEARLKAIPEITLCVDCADRH